MNQKEEWIIIKNTHEALVSRKDFDEVQEKIGHIVKRVNEARKSNGNNVRDFNFSSRKLYVQMWKTMYLYGKTKGSHRRFTVEIISSTGSVRHILSLIWK